MRGGAAALLLTAQAELSSACCNAGDVESHSCTACPAALYSSCGDDYYKIGDEGCNGLGCRLKCLCKKESYCTPPPPAGSPSCVAQAVEMTWQPLQSIVGSQSISRSYGTRRKTTSSSTRQWEESVTEAIRTGVNLNIGSEEGAGTVSRDTTSANRLLMSEAYTTEISSHEEKTESIGFPANAYQGKKLWQWVITTEDSCSETAQTKTREYCLTDGAWERPCCLPGFCVDHPSCRVCKSTDELISSAPHCNASSSGTIVRTSSATSSEGGGGSSSAHGFFYTLGVIALVCIVIAAVFAGFCAAAKWQLRRQQRLTIPVPSAPPCLDQHQVDIQLAQAGSPAARGTEYRSADVKKNSPWNEPLETHGGDTPMEWKVLPGWGGPA